jgi:cell division protease FtsH
MTFRLSKKKHWLFAIVGIIALLGIASGVYLKPFAQPEKLTFPEFVQKLEAGAITEVKIVSTSSLRSKLEGSFASEAGTATAFTAPVLLQYQGDLSELLAAHGFAFIEQDLSGAGLPPLVIVYIVMFIMLGLFMAQVLGLVNLAPSAGQKLSSPQVKFTDVAGIDDAKDEIMEVINLIKRRSSITELGGAIPKGVLLVGPPGNGKTLLAKAIASEAEIPFFEISGSSFVEKYVGTGAARVRSLFKKARKHSPCIVFIDEIDAVGGSRTDSGEGAAREHNQTLNALLVEMDGASGREGVIVVAATNRKDTLDKALLRPGRFDRTLYVGLPDVKGREAILRVHSRSVKLSPEVDLEEVARMTSGFSGAELAGLLNEAALAAGRRASDTIRTVDIAHGRDRLLLGAQHSGSKLNDREKWLTAYHEAGHTVVNHFMELGQRLERVTIIPRGGALGVTLMVPEEMKYGETRLKLLDTICVLMGGRAAEEVFLGDISSGASGDIGMATRYAKKMVCEWGMSATIGMVRYESRNEEYLSLHGSGGREVEEEIRGIINAEYTRALELVKVHRDKVERLTQALVERETLTKAEVDLLLQEEYPTAVPDSVTGGEPATVSVS